MDKTPFGKSGHIYSRKWLTIHKVWVFIRGKCINAKAQKSVQSAFAAASLQAVLDFHECPGCSWALLTVDEAVRGCNDLSTFVTFQATMGLGGAPHHLQLTNHPTERSVTPPMVPPDHLWQFLLPWMVPRTKYGYHRWSPWTIYGAIVGPPLP